MKVYQVTCRAVALIEETWELRLPDDFDDSEPGSIAEAFEDRRAEATFLHELSIDEHDREVIDAWLVRKDPAPTA